MSVCFFEFSIIFFFRKFQKYQIRVGGSNDLLRENFPSRADPDGFQIVLDFS